MPRPSRRLQPNLLIQNRKHAIGTTAAVRPFLFAIPKILDVASGPPQVAARLHAPNPGLRRSPLANAQHNRTPRSIQRRPHIRVRRLRIHRSRTAPVILQVVHAPRRILNRILIFVTQAARTPSAGQRSNIGIHAKLQTQPVNVVTHGLHAMRKTLRVDNDVPAGVAAHLPAVIDVNVLVTSIFHAGFHNHIRHALNQFFADVAGKLIP